MTTIKDVLNSVCSGEDICGEVILASFKDVVCAGDCELFACYSNQECKLCVTETATAAFEGLGLGGIDPLALMNAIGKELLNMLKSGKLSEDAKVNIDPKLI